MGAVAPGELEAGGVEFRRQLGLGVDPHVPALALGRVVLVGQSPVDRLRQPGRHRRGERTAGLQHPHHLRDRGHVVLNVLQDLRRDDDVEGVVGEREPRGVASEHALEPLQVDLTTVDHRAERGPRLDDLVLGVVERHDVRPSTGALEDVSAEPGADVEHPRAGREAEAFEADREHVRSGRCAAAWRRSAASPAPRGIGRP